MHFSKEMQQNKKNKKRLALYLFTKSSETRICNLSETLPSTCLSSLACILSKQSMRKNDMHHINGDNDLKSI